MQDIRDNIKKILTNLFNQAETQGGLEYIFTLVRVDGLTSNIIDPVIELHSKLNKYDTKITGRDDILSVYCSLTKYHEVLALVANLINCSAKKPFRSLPFHHLVKGQFPDFIYPTTSQIARELSKIANNAKRPDIASLIDEAYPDEILNLCLSKDYSIENDLIFEVLKKCMAMLSILLEIYFNERLRFKELPKFHKLPKFEVLELLVDDGFGLYGFQIHFSNGSYAKFARHKNSTECLNISPGDMSFYVGNLDELKHEWRVGKRLLYEIGIPGRYNTLGEWKPIIYPGKDEHLTKMAYAQSDDPEVQGTLFYIICTAHWVIEFVVRTTIDLPTEAISYGGKFHLWKCPPPTDDSFSEYNFKIYDGWFELDSIEPKYIENAIGTIGLILNSLAFAYNAVIEWRPKYTTVSSMSGFATPTEDDLEILNSILPNILSGEKFVLINAAIDWYNHGRSSKNVFTGFLCYYIALESVAIAIANGRADFGLNFTREPRNIRKKLRNECIKEKHDANYTNNPIQFVEEAYFDCIVGIKEKIEQVTSLVFGVDHKYLRTLFEKQDGYSLNDIRGKLAHGRMTILDKKHESIVKKRLPDIAEISREFLSRIILSLKPGDKLPTWSMQHSAHLPTGDPRTTLVASTDKIFPNKDWRIKPEWCDRSI